MERQIEKQPASIQENTIAASRHTVQGHKTPRRKTAMTPKMPGRICLMAVKLCQFKMCDTTLTIDTSGQVSGIPATGSMLLFEDGRARDIGCTERAPLTTCIDSTFEN